MPKYFSGRVKRTPQGSLTTDRYQYLGLDQAEPNLGDPLNLENVPSEQRYQIVSVASQPGKRFWVPLGGGVTPGSITIREEENIIPNASAASSITDVNFKGNIITAIGTLDTDGNPGVGVTIQVAPIGLDHQVLFNDNGEFGAASRLTYDNNSNRVGIGSTQPEQDLDLSGNLKITGNVYDKDNDTGSTNQVLIRSATGGLEWADQSITGVPDAGGEKKSVQFHADNGKIDGASNFVFDYENNNNRVGIGSTQPTKLLDVLGESKFTGNVKITGVTTFIGDVFVQGEVTTEEVTNIDSVGIVTAGKGLRVTQDGLIVVGVTTLQTTRFPNNKSLYLGANDALQIVHDGSNSIINDNGVGSLFLQQAGSTKLEVTGTGVTVSGVTSTTDLFVEDKVESDLIPDNTDGSKNLGSSSDRWGTVYADVFNGADFSPTIVVTEQLKVTGVSTFEGDVLATGVANTFTKRLDVGIGGTLFTAINAHDGDQGRVGIGTTQPVNIFQVGAGSTSFTISEKGNVGVGTTIPLARIHICNDPSTPYADTRLRLTQVDASANNRHWQFSTNTAETLRLQAIDDSNANDGHGSGGGNHFDFYRDGNDINEFRGVGIGKTWFVVDNKNFNVGIGTTNPIGSDAVISNTSVLAVGVVTANEFYGTLIGAAQSLSGGDAYKIPYQSAPSKTAFIDNGTNTGQLLQFNLGSAPSWVFPTGLTVKNVDGGYADLTQLNVSPGISTLTNLRVTGISTLTQLKVTGVSTFVEDILVGVSATVGFGTTAYFKDNAAIHLGDNEDLRIVHTNGESFIHDNGEGGLVFLTGSSPIEFRRNSIPSEKMLLSTPGGSVDLYFNGTKRFETTSDGVKITGGLQDKDGELGTNGQLLESTGSGINWVNAGDLTIENANKVGVGSINTGVTNATYNITVTAPTSSYYTLDGSDRNGTVTGNNQSVTLKVGDTINFNLSNVGSVHPFYIRVSSLGANVSTPAASGQGSTGNATVSWTPSAEGTYVYQCGSHVDMKGSIIVESLVPVHYVTFVDSNNPYDNRENEFIYSSQSIVYEPLDGNLLIGGFTKQSSWDTSKLAIKSGESNIGIIQIHADGGEIEGDLSGIAFSHGGFTSPGNSVSAARAKAAIALRSIGNLNGYGRGELCFYVDSAADDNPVATGDEKLRIGVEGQIGLGGANYGNPNQVLTSNGPNEAPTWENSSPGDLTTVDVKQQNYCGIDDTPLNPITVSETVGGATTIGIGTTSNAYGRKYVQGADPTTGGYTVCEGDIWYDTVTPSVKIYKDGAWVNLSTQALTQDANRIAVGATNSSIDPVKVYYPSFVDVNSPSNSRTYQPLYTGAGITFSPNTNNLSIDGSLYLKGTSTDYNGDIHSLGGADGQFGIMHDGPGALWLTVKDSNNASLVGIVSFSSESGNDVAARQSIFQSNLYPRVTETYDLGKSSTELRWNNVYANKFYGDGSSLTCVGGATAWQPDEQENLYAGTNAGNAFDANTYCNIAIGLDAGCNTRNTSAPSVTADNNIFLGSKSGLSNTISNNNVFLGQCAGYCNNNGAGNNVAIGRRALFCNTTGSHNIAIGCRVACYLGTGMYNIFLGRLAGHCQTSGDYNIAIGNKAQLEDLTGQNQLVIASSESAYWLRGDCSSNVQLGAGLKDCCSCLGTSGQFLCSTGTHIKWATVISTSEQACKLKTARCISMCGDMTWGVSFDGSQDVEACGTLATVNCSVGSYGNSTTVPRITVNGKGLITCVTTCAINFCTATVCQADTVKTGTGSCATNYIGFFELSGAGCYQEPKVDSNFLYDASNNKLTVPKIKPGEIIDSNDGTGTENYVIKADGDGGWAWGQVDGGSVGTLNFTDLDDTPANYTSHAHKLVRVNKDGSTNNGTALEFVDPSSVGAQKFTDLDDTPSSIANPGDDGKIVKVNAGALVFDTVSGLGGVTDVTVDYTGRSTPCTLPITVSEPSTGTKQINIPDNSNAFGAKYVQSTEPTGNTVCDGDIWYDTSTTGSEGEQVPKSSLPT